MMQMYTLRRRLLFTSAPIRPSRPVNENYAPPARALAQLCPECRVVDRQNVASITRAGEDLLRSVGCSLPVPTFQMTQLMRL